MAFDPLTLGLSTAASVGGSLLKKQAANQDYQNNLAVQQQQNANNIKEAAARTAFGNDFLAGYGAKQDALVNQNTANETNRLDTRLGAIAPTVAGYAAPAQEAERAGLAGQRFDAATAAMGPQATSAGIPLLGGQGKGATAAEYDKRLAQSNAEATDIAGRRSALGSYGSVWNRNDLREADTKRGTGVAEAIGKSRADVINEGVKTNKTSLKALPDLQELVGYQNRGAPINAPRPTSTALADILGGLGSLGGAVAGSGGMPSFPNFMTSPSGPGVVPRPSLFGR